MKIVQKVLLPAFLLLNISLFAQTDLPKKVLFVGNSYTYFWNLPQTVALMAENKNIDLTTRQSTAGGSTWGQHWRGEKQLNTLNIIEDGDFDIVIIQNHSMRSIEAPDSMMHYGKLLAEVIRKSGAQPYLYMTWAREWNPLMQKTITEKYLELGKLIDAKVIPIGLAWQRARELRPDFPLYDEDGSHQSTLGTYLSACVFFGALANQSPVGLPHRLTTQDKNGEKLYISIQSKENALFCQLVAEEILAEMKN